MWHEAIQQAQRVAAAHDPRGLMFNVGPVITVEDGTVISKEAFQRRQERAMEGKMSKAHGSGQDSPKADGPSDRQHQDTRAFDADDEHHSNVNPERRAQIKAQPQLPHRSKSQIKKLAKYAPRPPPPKPMIPDHIPLPEGEEDYLALWDLGDRELERRVIREKKRKAAGRKALRLKQQSGKDERRMARDEKRKVYREIKQEWRDIKGTATPFPFVLLQTKCFWRRDITREIAT